MALRKKRQIIVTAQDPLTCPLTRTIEIAWKKLPCRRATRHMQVTILPWHIENAICGSPTHCVLALALKDAFGDFLVGAIVTAAVTKIVCSDKVVVYRTPEVLRHAIHAFDKSKGKTWNFPLGSFYLLPGMKSNHKTMKREGGTIKRAKATYIARRIVPPTIEATAA